MCEMLKRLKLNGGTYSSSLPPPSYNRSDSLNLKGNDNSLRGYIDENVFWLMKDRICQMGGKKDWQLIQSHQSVMASYVRNRKGKGWCQTSKRSDWFSPVSKEIVQSKECQPKTTMPGPPSLFIVFVVVVMAWPTWIPFYPILFFVTRHSPGAALNLSWASMASIFYLFPLLWEWSTWSGCPPSKNLLLLPQTLCLFWKSGKFKGVSACCICMDCSCYGKNVYLVIKVFFCSRADSVVKKCCWIA